MANKVTFDYSLTENVISADEIKSNGENYKRAQKSYYLARKEQEVIS